MNNFLASIIPSSFFTWLASAFYFKVWKNRYQEKFKSISMIVSGTKISLCSTENPRYVLLKSSECRATTIELDLSRFGEAVEIAFGFVSHHR